MKKSLKEVKSNMQFQEPSSTTGKCPICGKPVVVRSTREPAPYCSKACASMKRYAIRYEGTGAGPMNRPDMTEKIKLP
jgi:hypothetical protein